MMAPYTSWRHMSMLDANILVLRVQYRGPRYWKVRVLWQVRGINLGQETIKIKTGDLQKWATA